MRRRNQLLSQDDTDEIMKKGTSGVLALLGDDDYPYALPISYVYSDGKIFFHCGKKGHKIDAVKKCDKASFCVIDKDDVVPEKYTTYFRSAIAFGKISIIEDEEEKRNAIKILAEKYCPFDESGILSEVERTKDVLCMLKLDIEHMTGKEAIELVRKKENKIEVILNSNKK